MVTTSVRENLHQLCEMVSQVGGLPVDHRGRTLKRCVHNASSFAMRAFDDFRFSFIRLPDPVLTGKLRMLNGQGAILPVGIAAALQEVVAIKSTLRR